MLSTLIKIGEKIRLISYVDRKINYIALILAWQLILDGLAILDLIGFKLQLLGQTLGFIYLMVVPGFLISRILKLYKLSTTEIITYSIGLSISLITFSVALVNSLVFPLGITKPISRIILLLTINIIVFLLSFICLVYCKDHTIYFLFKKEKLFNPLTLSLLFLPFMAILGSYLLNYFNNNILLLILLITISVIPTFVAFNKIPINYYPFLIWIISISLLLHNTLINVTVLGDLSLNYVAIEGFWDPFVYLPHNSLLFVVIPWTVFGSVFDISILWVTRILYPLIYSFTPVILYSAYTKRWSTKTSFMSSCLIMFFFTFFVAHSRQLRMGMSELFLAFLLLLAVDRTMRQKSKAVLSIIFAFSLVCSHYGSSYIFLIVLIISLVTLWLCKKIGITIKTPTPIIKQNFVLLFFVFLYSWYIYISGSISFRTITRFFRHFIDCIYTEFLSAKESYAIYSLQKNWSISIQISKYLIIVFFFFSSISVLVLIYKHIIKKESIIYPEHFAFSVAWLVIGGSVFLPTSSMNPARVSHIVLLFLSPFSVNGFFILLKTILRKTESAKRLESSHHFFSLLLIVLLLFHSGVMSCIFFKDNHPNILISKERILERNPNEDEINNFYAYYKSSAYVQCLERQIKNVPDEVLSIWGIWSDIPLKDWRARYPYNVVKILIDRGFRRYPLHYFSIEDLHHEWRLKHPTYVLLTDRSIRHGIIITEKYPSIQTLNLDELYPTLTGTINQSVTAENFTVYLQQWGSFDILGYWSPLKGDETISVEDSEEEICCLNVVSGTKPNPGIKKIGLGGLNWSSYNILTLRAKSDDAAILNVTIYDAYGSYEVFTSNFSTFNTWEDLDFDLQNPVLSNGFLHWDKIDQVTIQVKNDTIGYTFRVNNLWLTTWTDLKHYAIIPDSESIENYIRTVDYEMDYQDGKIKVLCSGKMANGGNYSIDYLIDLPVRAKIYDNGYNEVFFTPGAEKYEMK